MKEKEQYVFNKKSSMSYADFINGRKPDKTKELYDQLDRLSIEDIRSTFFRKGGQQND